jgi:plasmid maintenance system antidote protein VapI
MPKRKLDIESQLRKAIIESPLSRYKIAKESGVGEAPLSLFVNRKRTLTLPSAARVADVLGLELKPRATKRKAR